MGTTLRFDRVTRMQDPKSRGRPTGSRSAGALALLLAAACGGGSEPQLARPAGATDTSPTSPAAPVPDATPKAATASGAHDLYAQRGFTCEACHPCGKRDPNGHALAWMDQASPGFHAYASNSSLSSCQPCHGAALDGVGGTTTVSCAQCHGAAWRTNCTFCHGGVGSQTGAPPKTVWGRSADVVRVGAHDAHLAATHALSRPVPCATCHVVPGDALSTGHANGATADVAFSGLAVQGVPTAPAWNRAASTCSSTYCHGATLSGGTRTAPVWTTADGSMRACNACHGAPPPAPHPTGSACEACHAGYTATSVNAAVHVDGKVDVTGQTCTSCHGSAANAAPPAGTRGETATTTRAVGAHQAHLTATRWRATAIACSECHATPATMVHSNGTVDMTWGALSRTGGLAPTWTGTTCTNYCHGSALGAGGTVTAPAWTGGAGQAACGTCHGNPPPAPHVQSTACGSCHTGYTSTTVNGAVHIDGALNVVTQTCATCHGSAANAAPPTGTRGETATTTRAVGAHQAHLVSTTLRSAAIACAECHTVPTAMSHASGTVEMAWGALSRTGGFAPTWTGTTCTNYCHGSSLAAGGTVTAPSWTGGATQDACGTCHGVPPPAPHTTSTACGSCHAGYTSTTVNLATHIDGTLNVTGTHPAGWGAKEQHGYQANLTGLAGCKTCHGANLDGVGGSTSSSCTACHTARGFSSWATNCTFCHGNPTTGRQSPPVDIQGRSVASNVSVGKHDRHVAPAMMSPIACTECHAARTTSVIADAAHVDGNGIAEVVLGTRSRTGGAAATYTRASATSATCASNYCHGSFSGGTTSTPNWATGAAMTCTSCHRSPPQTGEHDKHMGKSAFNCSHCHNGIATGTGRTSTNAAIVNPANHVNGVKNVAFGGTYNSRTVTGTWNATTKTCTVSCHSSETW